MSGTGGSLARNGVAAVFLPTKPLNALINKMRAEELKSCFFLKSPLVVENKPCFF